MPSLIDTGYNLLSNASRNLGWAAQTFLPNQPGASWIQAANAQTPRAAQDLTRMLERGLQASTTQSGPSAPFENQGQPIINNQNPESQAQIDQHNQEFPYQNGPSMRDVTIHDSWFDMQRVGFLVLGISLIVVGVTFVVRNAGDMSLDTDLKKSQLKLNQEALANAAKTATAPIAPASPKSPPPAPPAPPHPPSGGGPSPFKPTPPPWKKSPIKSPKTPVSKTPHTGGKTP